MDVSQFAQPVLQLRLVEAAFTRGGVEPASLRAIHVDVSWVVSTPRPGVAALIGFTAQAKPVWFGSTGASALHTLPFGFNQGHATGTQGIGV